MKRYRIFDMRKGLMSADEVVYANSPKEAVEKAYPNSNVRRCTYNYSVRTGDWSGGNVVVNGSYCYSVTER